jgi:hypothetical protein
LHETLDGRSLELQAEILDGLGQDFLDVRRGFLEGAQGTSLQGSTEKTVRRET